MVLSASQFVITSSGQTFPCRISYSAKPDKLRKIAFKKVICPMSRLTDLLRSIESTDPKTAADLRKEIAALTHNQRTFGLVYEKHQPEAVQLPGIRIRRGSKVRILPKRASPGKGSKDLWSVESIDRSNSEQPIAHLVAINPAIDNPEDLLRTESSVEDLVTVAEFHDRIFPGLVETGRVERGGDAPFHSVINAENFHALEMLTYTHRHKVDAIYIDPPYNTGAKDWKYNNDYVDGEDAYRHSKWLSFMERRLKIAKELLNPADSVLIVTIDEKEYLRLGLLLEQVFPEASIQMVSSVINPGGASRVEGFTRVDEYIYFVKFGSSSPAKHTNDMLFTDNNDGKDNRSPIWRGLLRGGSNPYRADSPSKFYPVIVDAKTNSIRDADDPLRPNEDRASYIPPEGCTAVWPLKTGDVEGRWEVNLTTFRERLAQGYIKSGEPNKRTNKRTIYYLRNAEMERLQSGEIISDGMNSQGFLELRHNPEINRHLPAKTVWNLQSHNATEYGSNLIKKFLPGRKFPFPKSIYAVEDTLRFFVMDKKNAVIVDFFAGSGTTAHAVMRLNRQDGGHRQTILVTNNEVSEKEQKTLVKQELRPGDRNWESLGICDYVTKPRITAAITGRTPEGDPVKGDYKFTDEFPMSEGFEANAAFFTLTYESPMQIRHNRAFKKIAPLLWLRAGSQGRIIDSLGENGWDIADNYAVIENLNQLTAFSLILRKQPVSTVFVVTDDNGSFEMAARALPETANTVRLYSSYLENFEINSGRSV